jgi:hypothetical protein
MTTVFKTIAFAALSAGVLAASFSGAFARGKRVEKACENDYYSFCSQYDPDSSAVSRCFESNRKNLSRNCIRALVDAGDVPAKYLKK